jgi:hypothetical protein
VFDDVDPEQASYIGIADVPLIPLAHDKAIKGLFELKAANGRISGTIELELRWQFTYVPPKGMPLTEPVSTTQRHFTDDPVSTTQRHATNRTSKYHPKAFQ